MKQNREPRNKLLDAGKHDLWLALQTVWKRVSYFTEPYQQILEKGQSKNGKSQTHIYTITLSVQNSEQEN